MEQRSTRVQSSTTVQTNIRFDHTYLKTIPGILKCIQVLCDFLGFVCVLCSPFSGHSRGVFFTMVAMIGFWVSGLLLIFYLFHVVEKFYKIPWIHFELIFCFVWAILYLFAASFAAAMCLPAYGAAAFFGYCAMFAYAIDAFFKFKAMRAGELAQGVRIVSKETVSTVSTPQY